MPWCPMWLRLSEESHKTWSIDDLIPLKANVIVQHSALRTPRTIHIGVIRINKRAFVAAEYPVRAGRRFKTPSSQLGVKNNDCEGRKHANDVGENQGVWRHNMFLMNLL